MGPAQTWAAQQQSGTAVRWKSLELAAFRDHPRVRRALGQSTHHAAPVDLAAVGLILVGVLVFLYPILGMAAVSRGRFQTDQTDAATAIPASGTIFAIGCVLHVAVLVAWWTRSRTRNGVILMQGALAILLGGITLASMALDHEDFTSWGRWAIPVAVSMVLGLATCVSNAVFGPPPKKKPGIPRAAAIAAAAKLPEVQQQAVHADLRAAVADLSDRGLITASETERVRDAPLGTLSLAVSRGGG